MQKLAPMKSVRTELTVNACLAVQVDLQWASIMYELPVGFSIDDNENASVNLTIDSSFWPYCPVLEREIFAP